MSETLVGLLTKSIESFSDRVGDLIENPREAGRTVAKLSKWPQNFCLGLRDGLKYSRLLKRMYPNTGESSVLSVPIVDCLSDLERDLLLNAGVPSNEIAAFFEAWYCISGRLYTISREVLSKESDLPEALADLYELTHDAGGIAPFVAANIVISKESVRDCQLRFDRILAKKKAGSHGWATSRCESFPDVLSGREFTPVDDKSLQEVDLDMGALMDSQGMLLATSMTGNRADIFYESDDGTSQVIRVEEHGICATKVADLDGLICTAHWMRLMATLMWKSLQVASTFPMVELALTLMEVIGLPSDGVAGYRARGVGFSVRRHLSGDDRHELSTSITLLTSLMKLSSSIRYGSHVFVEHNPAEKAPVLGLTLEETKEMMRKEYPMPKYSYNHYNNAVKKIEEEMSVLLADSEKGLRPATEKPFAFDGALEKISEKLIEEMRAQVVRVQEAYNPARSRKRDVCMISGSLWLDRIAKGRLLTSERARELTYNRKRKDVPQELSSKRETAFYLPLYDQTVVFPRRDDVTNVRYTRLQVGSEADLTSAVNVLVAVILWCNGQEASIVEAAIEADKKGTGELLQFSSGVLGAEVRKMLAAKNEGDLKITDLVSCVSELHGPKNESWVIREVLSLAVRHGVVCTKESAKCGSYLKAVEFVRGTFANKLRIIEADTYVSLKGVIVRQVSEIGKGDLEFIVQDDTIDRAYEVTLDVFTGTTVDELSLHLYPKRKKKFLVARIEANNAPRRNVGSSLYGTITDVSVQ